MRKLKLVLLSLLLTDIINASSITFAISDGIEDPKLKAIIESNVTKILNEVNAACKEKRALDFSKMEVNPNVQESMTMLWEISPFMCTDDDIIEHCLTTGNGYQIRNIPLLMIPNVKDSLDMEEYQEAVISFDKEGNVEKFYLSISMNLYMNDIKSNLGLTDLHRRQVILDYVEQFRTAFVQKDIKFIEQQFSDESLCIVGETITQKQDSATAKIRNNIKQTKDEFIRHLRGVLMRVETIKVDIDNIEIMPHPVNPNFYGLTIKLGWSATNYHDEGYLFQIWDFTDDNSPQIPVTTWQPDMINGKPLPKEEIFGLKDFDI